VFVSICSLQNNDKASAARLPNYLIETQSFFHSPSPFGACGTTFAPLGSMSLDFQVALLPYKSSSFATPQAVGQ
jgi:hypothetical protein